MIHHDLCFNDIIARYVTSETGPPGIMLLPASCAGHVAVRREHIDSPAVNVLPKRWHPMPAREVDSLVQVAIREQGPANGFAQGRTMRNSVSKRGLRWKNQDVTQDKGFTRVVTTLEGENGLCVEHHLEHREGRPYLTLYSVVRNCGTGPFTVDALSSFSLSGLSPFDPANSPHRMRLHRFRSVWCAEARPEVRTFEELCLENSWTGDMPRCERFGVVGSMPLNGFVPLAAVEDTEAGVVWAACVEALGSWQMEVYRRRDEAAFSGGLADRELGHWWKVLAPGESFTSPKAWVTVTKGDVDSAWERLLEVYADYDGPASESDYPVIFNEWCTSWGNPTHKNVLELAKRLQGSGVRHVVIDDGWAERPPQAILQSNGDWVLNRNSFPAGIDKTAEDLRTLGFDPGIWFEFEVVNPGARAWSQTGHMLHRDGQVLQVGSRRFWDFRDPWVHAYLGERVLDFLRDNKLNYLKVDYNDTIGFGVDGAESPGEGLRRHLEGVHRFFRTLRESLPDLVIENCSSGGHRHAFPFLSTCAMSSFSDAHETPDIPVITANLLPVVPRTKLQVWAVLRNGDTESRLHYSLAATFLGRMCLSGDVHTLTQGQWETVCDAIAFYKRLAPGLAVGHTRRFGPKVTSYNYPHGWQAVLRHAVNECVIVAHTFAGASNPIRVPLPQGEWSLVDCFAEMPSAGKIIDGHFFWQESRDFCGSVWRLQNSTRAAGVS